jgi:hypothetical protein
MPLKEPELDEWIELDGAVLPPHLGLDMTARVDDIDVALHIAAPVTEIRPAVVYEAYYRIRDRYGDWHRTDRRVHPGAQVRLRSRDRKTTYELSF